MSGRIRAGQIREAPRLQGIELLAGASFAEVGLPDVAAHDPFSLEELRRYMDADRCWVAVDVADEPVGYVVVDVLDLNAHVEQVSVLPMQQGKGWGRRLMEHVERWTGARGYSAVTLTTFTDVVWNAPWYRTLGYAEMAEAAIGPELRAQRAEEAAHGLDPALRSCMVKHLRTDP